MRVTIGIEQINTENPPRRFVSQPFRATVRQQAGKRVAQRVFNTAREGKEEGAHMEPHDESQERITFADLIPIQLSDPIAVRLRMSGACRLLWAVLEDAIECYLRYGDHPSAGMRALFQEANDWIEAQEEGDLWTFVGICGALHLDPSSLRRGLRRRLREIRRPQTPVPLTQAA
jgi:hypothetical protein